VKISDIDGVNIAEILQNYHHPLFEMAYQMIEEKNFETDGNTHKHFATANGDNGGRVRRTDSSMYEIFEEVR
jgi:hypothetical protein